MVLNEGLNLFLYNFFHEGGQILKMVVERVAVDAAVLYNVLYGNLAQRPLVSGFWSSSFFSDASIARFVICDIKTSTALSDRP